MRVASLDELEASSSAGRWSSSDGAENDRNKKANEIVRVTVGSIVKEGGVTSNSKSKLWKDMSLKGAIQNWIMNMSTLRGIQDQRESVHQQ